MQNAFCLLVAGITLGVQLGAAQVPAQAETSSEQRPVSISWKTPATSERIASAPDIAYRATAGPLPDTAQLVIWITPITKEPGARKTISLDTAEKIPLPGKEGIIKREVWTRGVGLFVAFNQPTGRGELEIALFRPRRGKETEQERAAQQISNWLSMTVSFGSDE